MAGGRVHASLSSRARWAGLPKPSRAAGLWRQSTGYHKATWQHRLPSGDCARQVGFVARMVAQDREDGAAGRDTGLTPQSCASLPLHPAPRTSPLTISFHIFKNGAAPNDRLTGQPVRMRYVNYLAHNRHSYSSNVNWKIMIIGHWI